MKLFGNSFVKEEEIDKLTRKMGMLVLKDKKNVKTLPEKLKLKEDSFGSSKMMIVCTLHQEGSQILCGMTNQCWIVKSKSQRQALKVTVSKNTNARKERKKVIRLSQKFSA